MLVAGVGVSEGPEPQVCASLAGIECEPFFTDVAGVVWCYMNKFCIRPYLPKQIRAKPCDDIVVVPLHVPRPK